MVNKCHGDQCQDIEVTYTLSALSTKTVDILKTRKTAFIYF